MTFVKFLARKIAKPELFLSYTRLLIFYDIWFYVLDGFNNLFVRTSLCYIPSSKALLLYLGISYYNIYTSKTSPLGSLFQSLY